MKPEPQANESVAAVSADSQAGSAADDLRPGDFYMEGPYMVFTEQYHLRRGACCHSGCRHCPYR